MIWPLVGRDEELRRLAATLLRRGESALVAGPAGVGKSRLLAEVAQRAADAGWSVERTYASPAASTIPFGAVAHLLPDDAGTDRLALLRRTERRLRRRAEERPLLLVVDDAHDLDDGTAALVHRIAAGGGLPLLLAVRSEGAVPDTVTRIWKDGFAGRIDVEPLGRTASMRLVEAALGGPLAPGAGEALWRTTLGHPLFLRLVVESALADGTLRPTPGGWAIDDRQPLPPRLVEVIGSRLDALDTTTRRAFDAVAVASPVAARHLASLFGAEAATRLLQAGLVVADERGRIEPAHPLYAEVAAHARPGSVQAELRGRVAAAVLADPPDDRLDLVRATVWHVESGLDTSPVQLVAAAQDALRLHDFALAARLADAALAADPSRYDAAFTLGQARRYAGDAAGAAAAFGAADAAARRDADRAAVAVARAHNDAFGRGRFDDAVALLRGASRRTADPATRRQLDIERTFLASVVGDFGDVADAARQLLADPEVDAATLLSSSIAAAFAGVMTMQTGDLDAIVARARPVAAQVEAALPLARHQLEVTLALGRVAQGRVAEAIEVAGAGLTGAERDGRAIGEWAIVLAFALALGGDPGRAADGAADGTRALAASDPLGFLPVARAIAAVTAAQANRPDDAAGELTAAGDPRSEADRRVRQVITDRVTAWNLAWQGELTAAARIATEAGAEAMGASHRLWGVVALHDAVRFGGAQDAAALLHEAVRRCDGALVPAFLDHARALDAADPAALLACADTLAGLGASLLAAEAAGQAASLLATHGQTVAATRATAVSQLLAPAPGSLTPALRARPPGLSARELDVVRAAGRGLPSRRIAEDLVLSVRTIDNHLLRAYRKLGISGRDELVAALPPLSSAPAANE